jgi:Mg-chelatase subunit ChlD
VFDGAGQDRGRAMVVLTDGMPNRVPTPPAGGSQEDAVLAATAVVHRRAIPIFMVGYGRSDAPPGDGPCICRGIIIS